jgi:hypothetical protein
MIPKRIRNGWLWAANTPCDWTEKEPMPQDEKVIPITRGKPARLELTVTPGATSIHVQLQRVKTGPTGTASGRTSALQSHPPGTVVEFERDLQKGKSTVNRYEIADDNTLHAVVSTETGGAVFVSEQQFEELTTGWPVRRLVAIWNQLPGVRPVTRFENRSVAVRRIWQALQEPKQQSNNARSGRQNAKGKRHRRESKMQLVLRMLRGSEGAALAVLMKATGWQAHSVRGFLSGKVSRDLGLPLESFRRDGERVYRLPAEQ